MLRARVVGSSYAAAYIARLLERQSKQLDLVLSLVVVIEKCKCRCDRRSLDVADTAGRW